MLVELIVHAKASETFVISTNEAQDVLVSEHDSLINLCFPEPGPLVPRGEDLNSNILSSPLAPPHLPKTALPDALLQDDGSSYSSLDKQWKPCETGAGECQGCFNPELIE